MVRAGAGAAFRDTWMLLDLEVAWMGLIVDEQPAVYQVLQATGFAGGGFCPTGRGMQSCLCMMAVRLLEMRRVVQDTGSIYLHCDPTARHYLNVLMGSSYGRANFHDGMVGVVNVGPGGRPRIWSCPRCDPVVLQDGNVYLEPSAAPAFRGACQACMLQ